MMQLPSTKHSAMGEPMLAHPSTSRQSVNVPPVTCAPHSIRCPATVPPASLATSVVLQPNSWISGPSASALSTARPVITMSAPCSNAAAIGKAPRYALTLVKPLGRLAKGRSIKSSPAMQTTFRSSPDTTILLRSILVRPAGLTPPALVTILIFFAANWGRNGPICTSMKSDEKPPSGSAARIRPSRPMAPSAR